MVPLLLVFTLPLVSIQALSPIVELHGSGSSNPSTCFWHILEELESQTKVPVHLTYRATATGNGQKDFIGNITTPNNHFSSGDIPMTTQRYHALKNQSIDILHLPVLLGAIGIFHSVPLNSGYDLNMTSCLLARVFKRDIKDWKHPDIVSINPNLDIPIRLDNYGNEDPDQSYPIRVAHRLLESSSTFGLTSFLRKSCPSEWPQRLVGSIIDWPDDTVVCRGVPIMAKCIQDVPGTIGYLDAGHGHAESLSEVALEMDSVAFRKGSLYLTSENSIKKGGILPVLDEDSANIPQSSESDWSGVDLINQVEGYVYSWPIVLMTYVYVRKDLPSFLPDPRAQGLLVAFLKSLYNQDYVNVCVDRYQFIAIKGKLRDMALKGIDSLQTSPDAPLWRFEAGTVLEDGQGQYVISSRRGHAAAIDRENLITTVEASQNRLHDLESMLMALRRQVYGNVTSEEEMALLEEYIEEALSSQEDRAKRVDVAFVLSIVSLCLWVVTVSVYTIDRVRQHGKNDTKLDENPPSSSGRRRSSPRTRSDDSSD